jgi:hypothetical protein
MSKKIVLVAFLAAATLPSVTLAQGTVRGAEEGALSGKYSAGQLEPLQAPSAVSWAWRSDPGFAST